MNEIIVLDKIWNTVELFSDNDERCMYEFIKQVDPLRNLMENEAYTVLTRELLTKDVQHAMPDYVKTTQQVYRFLLDKFGGMQITLEKWVSQLEQTARIRHRGNRSRLEALEAASQLMERVTAIAPTLPEKQLESLLSHPQTMNRILMTLQTQDIDLFRSSLPRGSLSLSRRRDTESLAALRSFPGESIWILRDSRPPVPLFYHYDEYLVDVPDKDLEHQYYEIQEPRVCAEEDDLWWEPNLSHPCGLPGQVHNLAFCQEFWAMSPIDRHQKLLPGSLCKHCLGPLTLCSPRGQPCSNQVPEGLLCSGCEGKADDWGHPPFNALFCTKTDPDHRKQPREVIRSTAEEYLGGWSMKIGAESVNIDYPTASCVYRAHESISAVSSLHLTTLPAPSPPLTPGLEKRYPSLLPVWFRNLWTTLNIFYNGFESEASIY